MKVSEQPELNLMTEREIEEAWSLADLRFEVFEKKTSRDALQCPGLLRSGTYGQTRHRS